ncbi:MAG: IS66 family insertion sequence element accessory protein TnpA, partial [Enterovibrio sp.]
MKSGLSLRQFAQREGISQSTLHSWQKKYAEAGLNLTKNSDPDDWSAERKFSVVIETAAMSAVELSEYCRNKGL